MRAMSKPRTVLSSRRDFLVTTSAAAAAACAGPSFQAHVAGSDRIRVALVGCGGRGGGAAANALSVPGEQVELWAAADVFDGKPEATADALEEQFGARAAVPKERQFVGFDGYKQAMDSLRPGDIVILTTPPAFRWVHYAYAIEKDLNVFMEKPVTVDGPSAKRMLALNEKAKAKGLKVGVGLMSRHNFGMQELKKRIEDGELGEILMMRGYRMHGPAAFFRSLKKPAGISDLMYQIQRFHSFLWASGGNFSDFNIHIIDHLCWMKGAWPAWAQGIGGRHYREGKEGVYVDQNLDSYGIEYVFDDGTRLFFDGRTIDGCKHMYASYAHGTKGIAVVSAHDDCGLPSAIYKGQRMEAANLAWQSQVKKEDENPYQNEWNVLIKAVRDGLEHNEVDHGVRTSLITAMGRMAAHTGQVVTPQQMLDEGMEFAPDVDKLTMDSPAPLLADANGRYPVPMPGQKGMREY